MEFSTSFRKVGGSLMVTIPKAVAQHLGFTAAADAALVIDGERLIIEKRQRHRLTLTELLAQCDFTQPISPEEQAWLDEPLTGGEMA